MSAPLGVDLDTIARGAGLGIEEVRVSGHRHASDSDILDALDLPNVRSMARFDSEEARRRIERLPWIASAEITRVFPDRLDIRVRERRPFAIWQRGNAEILIDETGRELQRVAPGTIEHLPRVIGEGAVSETGQLLATIARHDALVARFIAAERVGERRWTLHLRDGLTMHLPPDGQALALEQLAQSGRLAWLHAQRDSILDLRAPGRVTVRRARAGKGAVAGVQIPASVPTARRE